MQTEKKDRRNKGKNSIATVLISVSITIILVVNAFCTLAICCPQIFEKIWPVMSSNEEMLSLTDAERVESALLANGLSIIGMAVAVWASLNIANSINQKDFDKTQKRMSKAEKDIEDIEKTIAPLRNEASGIKNTLRDLFLEELLKIPSIDIPSNYFYKRFSEINISEDIVSFLTKIEQTFYQVYMLHDSQSETKTLLIKKANDGILLIDKAKELSSHIKCNSKEKDLLCLYFKQRRAEFAFYKGYEHNGYNNFFDALKEYEELAQEFGCSPMPEYNIDFIIPALTDDEDIYRNLKIYFANTIGEAHSKIIENYNQIVLNTPSIKEKIKEHGNKAIFYCKCATTWESKSFDKPEVYYRNLGCAYERWDKIYGFGNHSKEIFESYKKAFTTMNFDERPARVKNVYHTLLSYYNKYFNTKYGLFSKENFHLTEISSNDVALLKEFYDYSMFAKEHFCKNNLPYVMNGFALSNILKLKEINTNYFNDLTKEFCLETIRFDLLHLQLLEVNDPYTEELKRRYDILKQA